MIRFVPVFAAFLLFGSLAPTLPAQEEPLTAGSGGVPVPKRSKTVPPEYPAEAQAQGIRAPGPYCVPFSNGKGVLLADLPR
jgi:hypothetical protein